MLKQKTVYFREEDLPLWEAVENKAEWLHIALEKSFERFGPAVTLHAKDRITDLSELIPTSVEKPGKIIKTKKDAIESVTLKNLVKAEKDIAKAVPHCKIHGTPLDSRGKCLQKGCKYA